MICCEKLTKRYGKKLALDALDLAIGAGEVHGFVGPNGAGKTTTMKILATLMRPTSGDATIDGVSVCRQPELARQLVGYMPDFFGVYDNLKTWEYLDFYAGCMQIGVKEKRKRIDELLDLTGLMNKREAYVDSLSRGMKQRLCLARALIHDPKLLILDEPASGMDPAARAQMREILCEIGKTGKTVLISSHILPELAEMCSHMTILKQGKRAFCGPVEALELEINAKESLVIRFSSVPDGAIVERIEQQIAQMYGITPRRETPQLWRIDQMASDDEDARLLHALVENHAPVCSYHRETATLEEVFMEVMKHDESDL